MENGVLQRAMESCRLHHDKDRGLIICTDKKCESALVPTGIIMHLRNKHKRTEANGLSAIREYIQKVIASLRTPSTVQQEYYQAEIPKLKKVDGYACNIPECARRKGWLSKHRRRVEDHISSEHGTPSSILNVKFQSVFNKPNYRPFIIYVKPDRPEINLDQSNHTCIYVAVTIDSETLGENVNSLFRQVRDPVSTAASCFNSMPICQNMTLYDNYHTSIHQSHLQASLARHSYSLSRSPSSPSDLRTCEVFFRSIKDYIVGAFENKIFILDKKGELVNCESRPSPGNLFSEELASHRSSLNSAENLKNFHVCCLTAVDLLGQNRPEGMLLFRKAAILVEQLLQEQDPRLLEILADVSMLLCLTDRENLYISLRDQMCNMVATKAQGRENQPWAQIFSQLRNISASDVRTMISRSWQCGYDQFTRSPIGPLHAVNISCYSNFLSRMNGTISAGNQLYSFLAQMAKVPGTTSQDLQIQYEHGKSLYLLGEYHQSLETMNEVILECETAHINGQRRWRVLQIEALEILARCYHDLSGLVGGQDKLINAKAALERATRLSKLFYGSEAGLTLGLKYTAWVWYQEQGLNDDANNLMQTMVQDLGDWLKCLSL